MVAPLIHSIQPIHPGAATLLPFTDSPQQSFDSLVTLKNEIIGHPERKRQKLDSGIVPSLLHVLLMDGLLEEKVQAAIVLASLFQELHTSSIIPTANEGRQIVGALLRCIKSHDTIPQLSLPCLRALSCITEYVDIAGTNDLTLYISILRNAISTTKVSALNQAYYVAMVLARSTSNSETIISALIEIVIDISQLGRRYNVPNTPSTRLLEASLSAIATICRTVPTLNTQVAAAGRMSIHRCESDETPMISTLLRLVKHESNLLRLAAASCLSNLYRYGAVPRKYHKTIALSALPILVRLFDEPCLKSQASTVLTDLVKDSDVMQKAACDAGAIKRIATILATPDASDEDTNEAALLAIAAITLQKDEYRKQVIDARIVPLIVSALSHSSARVRAAACQCARSMSRSVAMLRTSLIDAGVASAILPLLSDTHINVKTAATAAICNLVLDFSPMRKTILDFGILPVLAKLCHEENAELRLNAVWALKHIVYTAETDIKESVLYELSGAYLLRLCDDSELAIQEQACEVVRNVVSGKPESIDLLIEGIGIERLADFLIRKLRSGSSEVVVPAIYSLVHVAAGSERHRMILMQRPAILEALKAHIRNPNDEIRIGAVWTIINLTWHEDEVSQQERRSRVEMLTSLGFVADLNSIADDTSLDVRERVKTALAQMQ